MRVNSAELEVMDEAIGAMEFRPGTLRIITNESEAIPLGGSLRAVDTLTIVTGTAAATSSTQAICCLASGGITDNALITEQVSKTGLIPLKIIAFFGNLDRTPYALIDALRQRLNLEEEGSLTIYDLQVGDNPATFVFIRDKLLIGDSSEHSVMVKWREEKEA